VSTFDLNDLVDPPLVNELLARAEGIQWTGSPPNLALAGAYTSALQTAGPGATSHAFILTSLSATVPAVSSWGMTVGVLMLLIAACATIRARVRPNVGSHAALRP
jgi:hypothetical protein